jgi:alkanesulfonate monooxygenase SsuD/methylene tetrahydromethanopterin reductase-like flavin-dependent oxidoreductase (luciferase family)
MITAQIAWELAQNTKGKFRLGLGSQVKAHITKRYASTFDKPAPQMKDYVRAVKACLRAAIARFWCPRPTDCGVYPPDTLAFPCRIR